MPLCLSALPACHVLPERRTFAGSFRGRSADFLWMLLFGGALLTCIAPWVNIQFLGSSLTFMMVYVWGRRHQVRFGLEGERK